jgi:hypothetical protein
MASFNDRKLTLNIPFPSENIYAFRPLYPGSYQFNFGSSIVNIVKVWRNIITGLNQQYYKISGLERY